LKLRCSVRPVARSDRPSTEPLRRFWRALRAALRVSTLAAKGLQRLPHLDVAGATKCSALAADNSVHDIAQRYPRPASRLSMSCAARVAPENPALHRPAARPSWGDARRRQWFCETLRKKKLRRVVLATATNGCLRPLGDRSAERFSRDDPRHRRRVVKPMGWPKVHARESTAERQDSLLLEPAGPRSEGWLCASS